MSAGSTTFARGEQARAQDTLRWGGMFGMSFAAAPTNPSLADDFARAQAHSGLQLVNAHWRWPLSWRLALVIVPRFDPTETGSVTVTYDVTIGSGDAQMTFTRALLVAANAGGTYDPVIDNVLALPACDLLIRARGLLMPDNAPLGGPGALEIGAFVAPETEPHTALAMLECLCRIEGRGGAAPGIDERVGDWMPPGFTPEPLRYGR